MLARLQDICDNDENVYYENLWVACHNNLEAIHGQETQQNRNLGMRFHRHCKFLLGFEAPKKNDSILEKNWPRNNLDAKYDTYEEKILTYNMGMDQSYGWC